MFSQRPLWRDAPRCLVKSTLAAPLSSRSRGSLPSAQLADDRQCREYAFGTLGTMTYLPRALDLQLDELLPYVGAIAIDGPKGVGKTNTAE